MGRDLYEEVPAARQVFDEADRTLGFPLSKVCFEGPQEELLLTENTQPAILTVSIAFFTALRERGEVPDFVAGHSLGEYSALVAANALTFEDAVRTVRKRGRFMQEAVAVGEGSMAAILGLDLETLQEVCREAAEGEVVEPANINSPGQIVIAGNTAAVERASELAAARGAKKALKLPVSAPFHCRLMQPARERLAEVLKGVSFNDLEIPLVNNAEGKTIEGGDEARQSLIRQVTSAVQWTDSILRLVDLGVERFVEVGPGRVLSGLVRRISRQAETIAVGRLDQLTSHV